MNKNNKFILPLLLCSMFFAFTFSFLTAFASTPRVDGGEPGGGGSPHAYYGGIFGISTEWGEPIIGLNHYVAASSSYKPLNNYFSFYHSNFYPSYCTYPQIVDQVISGNFAWIKVSTNWSGVQPGVYTGEHAFRCDTVNYSNLAF